MDERLSLLINSPPLSSTPTRAIQIPYPGFSKERPSVLRSIAVASNSSIASVTHKDGTTETFDLVNGRLISSIRTYESEKLAGIWQLFLTPNGRVMIASAHWPKSNIKIWDVQSGELLRESPVTLYPRVMTSEGRNFVFSQGDRLGIYDIATRETTWSTLGRESLYHIALSPNDQWAVLVFEKKIESWKLAKANDHRLTYVKHGEQELAHSSLRPSSVAFSNDNQSCYGSLTNGRLVEYKLPNLEFPRCATVPDASLVMLTRIPATKLHIMEVTRKGREREAFWVDMEKETALRFQEYSGNHCRVAPLRERQVLLATTRELKIIDSPDGSGFVPAGQVVPGMLFEKTVSPIIGKASPRSKEPPKLPGNCRDFQLEAVGVYEGSLPDGRKRGFREKVHGYVDVSVGRTDIPIKLLLCSYEPVIWRLEVSSGTRILEVLLSGPNESKVEGLSGTVVTFLGGAYAYRDNDLSRLNDLVMRRTGCEIRRFQGTYHDSRFSIGALEYQGQGQRNKIYKTINKDGQIEYRNYPE
jgi:hypothetical protein